jgi:hypothetical protein
MKPADGLLRSRESGQSPPVQLRRLCRVQASSEPPVSTQLGSGSRRGQIPVEAGTDKSASPSEDMVKSVGCWSLAPVPSCALPDNEILAKLGWWGSKSVSGRRLLRSPKRTRPLVSLGRFRDGTRSSPHGSRDSPRQARTNASRLRSDDKPVEPGIRTPHGGQGAESRALIRLGLICGHHLAQPLCCANRP